MSAWYTEGGTSSSDTAHRNIRLMWSIRWLTTLRQRAFFVWRSLTGSHFPFHSASPWAECPSRWRKRLSPYSLLIGGAFYAAYLLWVFRG